MMKTKNIVNSINENFKEIVLVQCNAMQYARSCSDSVLNACVIKFILHSSTVFLFMHQKIFM